GYPDYWQRSQCRRADRHHPAHWNCQEKRHYDDRFRFRSRAGAGEAARRGNLPGESAALSSHHDDYNGGPAGRIAAGPRPWHGLRTPTPTWNHHRWRIDAEPVAHALHYARNLSL